MEPLDISALRIPRALKFKSYDELAIRILSPGIAAKDIVPLMEGAFDGTLLMLEFLNDIGLLTDEYYDMCIPIVEKEIDKIASAIAKCIVNDLRDLKKEFSTSERVEELDDEDVMGSAGRGRMRNIQFGLKELVLSIMLLVFMVENVDAVDPITLGVYFMGGTVYSYLLAKEFTDVSRIWDSIGLTVLAPPEPEIPIGFTPSPFEFIGNVTDFVIESVNGILGTTLGLTPQLLRISDQPFTERPPPVWKFGDDVATSPVLFDVKKFLSLPVNETLVNATNITLEATEETTQSSNAVLYAILGAVAVGGTAFFVHRKLKHRRQMAYKREFIDLKSRVRNERNLRDLAHSLVKDAKKKRNMLRSIDESRKEIVFRATQRRALRGKQEAGDDDDDDDDDEMPITFFLTPEERQELYRLEASKYRILGPTKGKAAQLQTDAMIERKPRLFNESLEVGNQILELRKNIVKLEDRLKAPKFALILREKEQEIDRARDETRYLFRRQKDEENEYLRQERERLDDIDRREQALSAELLRRQRERLAKEEKRKIEAGKQKRRLLTYLPSVDYDQEWQEYAREHEEQEEEEYRRQEQERLERADIERLQSRQREREEWEQKIAEDRRRREEEASKMPRYLPLYDRLSRERRERYLARQYGRM